MGLAANTLSALAGGGTGLLQLPLLIWLGLPFSVALATHKVTTVAMGTGALFYALKKKNLNFHIILLLFGAGLPGVLLGAKMVLLIPETIGLISLGLLNIAIACYSIADKNLGQTIAPATLNNRPKSIGLGALVLFLIGIINGSLTSGTGLMVTLWLVRWFGLDYRLAIQHTLVIVGIFWNAAGAITLTLYGEVNWQWVAVLFPAAALGSWLGVYIGSRISNQHIKRLFEVSALIAGAQLIMQPFY
nr:sulfite exporter TauE/SafE family protein [Motiliproteus sp. MSK22-1]